MNGGQISHKYFILALFLSGCESTETKTLPTCETGDSELPWGRPASWEGGLPGMGGIGNKKNFTGVELFIGKSGSVKLKKCRRLRKINNWQLLK